MKEKIVEKSTELFLNLGFKSVTMDEIASALGVSKKTIYKYFKNKTELVAAVTDYMFSNICNGINMICDLNKNPIDEIFDIKRFVMSNLKKPKKSVHILFYQIFSNTTFMVKIKDFVKLCILHNHNNIYIG